MKILYGTINSNIEVTEVCKNNLMENNTIIIPASEIHRNFFFTDPLPGVIKNVYIILDGRFYEFGNDVVVKINFDSQWVQTLSRDSYHPKVFEMYNLNDMLKREEDLFDLETYKRSTQVEFKSKDLALSHWYCIGRKQGYKYSKFGHHTLMKIIVPVLNEDILLEPFLEYYGNLIGFENIIILDNQSTSEIVKNIYEKYKDKITIFYTPYYFDSYEQFEKANFDILVSELSRYCKYLSKIDCDEFLAFYDYHYDNFFSKEQFHQYLMECKQHIGSYVLNNFYTDEIRKDPKNFNQWITFEPIQNFSNRLALDFGKTIMNTNLPLDTKIMVRGNHNGDKLSIFDSLDFYKMICLHLSNIDIPTRIKNAEKLLLSDIIDLKDLDYDIFLLALENYKLPTGESRHKLEELNKYYRNPENYIQSLLHKEKVVLETNIIQSTIFNDKNSYTKFNIYN